MDSLEYYDALYELASEQVGEELFGASAALAREAFARSVAGASMPTVWFELPLLGDARFDLHMAYANEALHAEAPFVSEAADGHGGLLNWYASRPREGAGLALAYDVGDGRIADPAVHANVNGAATFDTDGFFSRAGSPQAAEVHDGFVRKLPQGWREWYFGVHPGRPHIAVRVDCFVSAEAQRSYAADEEVLGADLARVGVGADPWLLRIGRAVARSRFGMELQFDVLADCTTGGTVSVSAGLPLLSARQVRPLWEDGGEMARLMELAEALGMCDGRWRGVPKALFTTMVRDGERMLALYCVPTYAKLRVRDGMPLDAKVYLQAGVRSL